MIDFTEDCGDLGWTSEFDDYGDVMMAFGDTGAQIAVQDWIEYSYGCIRIICSYEAPVEVVSEFPLAEVNAFLTTYGLGFQLTTGLPDASGEGFGYSTFVDSGYHGMAVTAPGDQAAAWDAILEPIVTATGYAYDDDWGAYVNDDEHIVRIAYDSSEGYTFVTFWE